MLFEFKNRVRGWLAWLGYLLLCLLIIAIGEWLPLMPTLQRFQEAHRTSNQALIAITVIITSLGTLLLAFTQFIVRVPDPRFKSQSQGFKTRDVLQGPRSFFSGIFIFAGFSDEAPIWRIKQAFQDGEWWSKPRWRRFTLVMLGAILLFYGLFGLLILLSPPGVKFLLFLAVVYATGRSVYAFVMDRPNRDQHTASK